jgi:hypothetical protein
MPIDILFDFAAISPTSTPATIRHHFAVASLCLVLHYRADVPVMRNRSTREEQSHARHIRIGAS